MMQHTKISRFYRPCGFRQDFLMISLAYVKHVTLGVRRASLSPRDIIGTNLVGVY